MKYNKILKQTNANTQTQANIQTQQGANANATNEH